MTSIPSTNLENILNCSTNGHAGDGQVSQTLSSDLVIFNSVRINYEFPPIKDSKLGGLSPVKLSSESKSTFPVNAEMFLALEKNIIDLPLLPDPLH